MLRHHHEASGQSVMVGHDAGARVQRNQIEDLLGDGLGVDVMLLAAERALGDCIELRGRTCIPDEGHVGRQAYLEGGGALLVAELISADADLDHVATRDDAGPIGVVVHLYDSCHNNLRPFKG